VSYQTTSGRYTAQRANPDTPLSLSLSLSLCPFIGFLHKPPTHHHARTPQLSSSICPLPYKIKKQSGEGTT